MSSIREIVEDAYQMTEFDWKPLYPNNMPCNGKEGYYAVKLHESDDGVISGRKYTILFQRETDEEGCLTEDAPIEYYVLFEKNYLEVQGRIEHPEPSNESCPLDALEDSNTLNILEINDYGRFSFVCKTLEEAKKMARRDIRLYLGMRCRICCNAFSGMV